MTVKEDYKIFFANKQTFSETFLFTLAPNNK